MPKRIDQNHKAIVDGLRAYGFTVESLAPLGKGRPDILCGKANRNWLFEIKNPSMPPSKQRLTEAEEEWHSTWRGQIAIVKSLDEALAVIGATK